MLIRFRKATITGVSVLALTACGGGGSSSTPPQTSGGTPTPSNTAPVANIVVSDTSPNEGLSSNLNASTSTDADGDTLSFSWTQLSGPTLTFSASNNVVTDITVPNLDSDETARIQLQVSDGTNTTTQEVTLNLTNVVLTPVANPTITAEKSLIYPNEIIDVPTVTRFFETSNFLVHQTNDEFVWDTFGYNDSNEPVVLRESFFTTVAGKIISEGLNTRDRDLAVTSENLVSDIDLTFAPPTQFVYDAEQPCAFDRANNFRNGNRVIGHTNGGLSLVSTIGLPTGGSTTVLQQFGGNASLCEMQVSSQALIDRFSSSVDQRLLVFDETNQEIISLEMLENRNQELSELVEDSTVALDLELPAGSNVEFVTSLKLSANGAGAMALLFSDGETEGNHRLVIVGLGSANEILQQTYSWAYGVPSSMSITAIDDFEGDTLVITTSDAPHALVFKSGEVGAGPNDYLPLSGPSFFDLGIGHGTTAPFRGGPDLQRGIIVTYPAQNLIKVLERN
ncbi:PKD domain-containing protein [Hellea sp.]|nr:PKD domain-containing protein [Hellea sp.]